MDKKELRYNPINIRVVSDENGTSRTIRGTAIVFNSPSQVLNERGLSFVEVILPESITQELVDNSDIVMLYNHKQDAGVLARSKNGTGTLKVILTETGVDFEFEAPNSPNGDNILESVKRGDLDACSFAFYIASGGESWQKEDGRYLRTIKSISALTDFSIVVNPAYTATSVNTRGLEDLLEKEKIDNEAAELRKQELLDYYSKLEGIIDSL